MKLGHMKGRHPKPLHMRQNRTKKAGRATLETQDNPEIPEIPNPDAREWHPLTLESWKRAWESPMAGQWIESDRDALGRLALLWDQFYRKPNANIMKEIRLQSSMFGLSPLDRSRLQWEVNRGDEADRKLKQREQPVKRVSGDPRAFLQALK